MNTPSHVLINLALKSAGKKRTESIPWLAVFLGSFMPDVPLGILSIAATFYFRVILGNQSPDLMEAVLHPLYFTNPFWISAHHLLHAPLALGLYLVVLWRWRARPGKVQHWLFWFVVSCALHASVDILTHFNDGPLLFWPLNWSYRFPSPISYWDPAHFGRQFMVFELILDAVLLTYLVMPNLKSFINLRLGKKK
jgi:membrane-bound metal-dependent hydrolase YbcI (DUF457 family)